ncbi:unnamed protein product [Clonostachys solani]|uniref:Sulfotransferase family protein n=1 Tax=Clonostachys solani TaxID=160281 RepID=A0A9N9ZGQ6_9HYPO|nr:unnamed protein product [Clonostachys solani]
MTDYLTGGWPIVPFAKGPKRPKQIISLGLYRTGSQSLKEALASLDIVTSFIHRHHSNTREDWDAYQGSCEALTDITPFAESRLNAYPEAHVILVT